MNRHDPLLIAGAGIGGLAAALALAQRQIPSIVLERRSRFAEEGAGIQIGPNGTAILHALGVAPLLQPSVAAPSAIRVHDGRCGRILARLPLGRWIEQRHGSPYWVAHRSDLHGALLTCAEAQSQITLVLDAAIDRVTQTPASVSVTAGDGRTWTGTALIGADGLWSTVRGLAIAAVTPCYAGHCAVRTTIAVDPRNRDGDPLETGVWLRPEGHVVHYPVRGGREIAVIGIFPDATAHQDWSGNVDSGWVTSRASRFPEPVRRLFAAAPSWRKWGLHTLEPTFGWSRGNIALLGDAAHPVLPFLAQGAVLALEDAVVLADAVATHANVAEALAGYERRRRDRANRVAAASRRNGRIYHLGGPLAMARNLALRALPAERIMAGYDWVYGWKGSTAAGPLRSRLRKARDDWND